MSDVGMNAIPRTIVVRASDSIATIGALKRTATKGNGPIALRIDYSFVFGERMEICRNCPSRRFTGGPGGICGIAPDEDRKSALAFIRFVRSLHRACPDGHWEAVREFESPGSGLGPRNDQPPDGAYERCSDDEYEERRDACVHCEYWGTAAERITSEKMCRHPARAGVTCPGRADNWMRWALAKCPMAAWPEVAAAETKDAPSAPPAEAQ
jgi:hypothetical protein